MYSFSQNKDKFLKDGLKMEETKVKAPSKKRFKQRFNKTRQRY